MTARRLRSHSPAILTGQYSMVPGSMARQYAAPRLPDLPGDLTSHAASLVDCPQDDAIAMLDTEGRVTSWTRAAQSMLGYCQPSILGQHVSVFYTEQDRASDLPQCQLNMAAETGLYTVEGWRLRKDGTTLRARVALQAVAKPDGTVGGFMMVIRDIGEQMELLALPGERDRTRKFETIGRLSGNMANELIGVMAEIHASHDMAVRRAMDEPSLEALASGNQAILHGRKLLLQLRAFAAHSTDEKRAVNLNDLIASMDTLIASAIGPNFDLRLCLGAPSLSIMVDPAEFQLILLEMVMCARCELPQGGVVTVFVESQIEAVTAPAGAIGPGVGDPVGIGVSVVGHDTGCRPSALRRAQRGMDDPTGSFFQGSLSRWDRFARRAGGQVKLDTVAGERTNYTMTLPGLALPVAADDGGKGARTILLVDDDTNVLALVSEMLAYFGHKVVLAQDGSEALARLHTDHSIDALFADIVLPTGMNGLQLMQAARSARPGLRAALASVRSRDDLRELGGIPQDVAFFAKPYALADVNAYLTTG